MNCSCVRSARSFSACEVLKRTFDFTLPNEKNSQLVLRIYNAPKAASQFCVADCGPDEPAAKPPPAPGKPTAPTGPNWLLTVPYDCCNEPIRLGKYSFF